MWNATQHGWPLTQQTCIILCVHAFFIHPSLHKVRTCILMQCIDSHCIPCHFFAFHYSIQTWHRNTVISLLTYRTPPSNEIKNASLPRYLSVSRPSEWTVPYRHSRPDLIYACARGCAYASSASIVHLCMHTYVCICLCLCIHITYMYMCNMYVILYATVHVQSCAWICICKNM